MPCSRLQKASSCLTRTGDRHDPAQGLALSVISTPVGQDDLYLWHGQRWLSGPNNPPECQTLCQAATGSCAQSPGYVKGHDFDYWIPLQFDAEGHVRPFAPFVDSFQVDVL